MKFKHNIERHRVYAQFNKPVFCKAIRLSRVDAHKLALRNRLYHMIDGKLNGVCRVKSNQEAQYYLDLEFGEIYILTNDLH